jgi:transketolase
MRKNEDIVVLLGDLGYGLFDDLRNEFPARCINVGAAEQLMLGAAVGLSIKGKTPICYSITPFLLYRPFEFIRNYLNQEQIPVKLVGSGRNTDYKKAGYTHHSEEAEAILNELKNIKKFFPENNNELLESLDNFIYSDTPSFLSLKK